LLSAKRFGAAGTSCFFSALKEVMQLSGLDLGGVRTPLQRISKEETQALKEGLTRIGFFEFCR
jgi:dihydrodipicolinate synthase/N-acetylneuraminate lyase